MNVRAAGQTGDGEAAEDERRRGVAEQKKSQLDQGEGLRNLERWVTGILGWAIIVTLIAVPVLTIILIGYLLIKF
jgi:hypothetical protein